MKASAAETGKSQLHWSYSGGRKTVPEFSKTKDGSWTKYLSGGKPKAWFYYHCQSMRTTV